MILAFVFRALLTLTRRDVCGPDIMHRWRSGSKLSHTVDGRHNPIGREVMDHVARSRNSNELAPA